MNDRQQLTPQQTALKEQACLQLRDAQTTLERLHRLPADQGDAEAVADALDAVRNAQTLLAEWYGCEPDE